MFEGKISFKMQYLVCLNGSCLGLHFFFFLAIKNTRNFQNQSML